MNAHEYDPQLRIRSRFVMPSAAMIGVSVGMFIFAGPVFHVTGDAADNLTDTTKYVHAVLGDPDEAIGQVLPPGPSGLDNVPEGALNSIQEESRQQSSHRDAEDNSATEEEKPQ